MKHCSSTGSRSGDFSTLGAATQNRSATPSGGRSERSAALAEAFGCVEVRLWKNGEPNGDAGSVFADGWDGTLKRTELT